NRRTKKNNVLQMIYFGRLVPDKGVHTAIEALGHLRERQLLQHVKLTILGGGHPDYERKLRELAEEKGVQERIQFARQIPREDIVKVLGRFDVFLFTSIWPEPMARSVMEAMAAGLLVIGTTVGGQGEMLEHGRNGLTYPAENATVLADRIDQALREPALRTQLAQAGQNMVIEKYTLERMIIEIEQFLMSVAWNPGQRLLALPDFQAR
ncbi:MAG: glycosyltransferase family 4 protein, partial [Caldilineaceae bacterium]